MFQGKGFIILLVIASFALEQLEAKPHIIHPKIILKDIKTDTAYAAIKTNEAIKAKTSAAASIVSAPIKIAKNIASIKADAIKTAAVVKTVAAIKGAVLIKKAAVIKGAAVVKGVTALKAGAAIKGAAALKTNNLTSKKTEIVDSIKTKPILPNLKIVDTIKGSISGIVNPTSLISIDASKPLLGLL